ncbi:hypothetical protein WA016_03605 [Myxococcus stipitatus]
MWSASRAASWPQPPAPPAASRSPRCGFHVEPSIPMTPVHRILDGGLFAAMRVFHVEPLGLAAPSTTASTEQFAFHVEQAPVPVSGSEPPRHARRLEAFITRSTWNAPSSSSRSARSRCRPLRGALPSARWNPWRSSLRARCHRLPDVLACSTWNARPEVRGKPQVDDGLIKVSPCSMRNVTWPVLSAPHRHQLRGPKGLFVRMSTFHVEHDMAQVRASASPPHAAVRQLRCTFHVEHVAISRWLEGLLTCSTWNVEWPALGAQHHHRATCLERSFTCSTWNAAPEVRHPVEHHADLFAALCWFHVEHGTAITSWQEPSTPMA